MGKQPNFLFFMTDQHRADWLGCYGHPVVKSPNIDAIAQSGIRFDNFYVASPVCMPNRATFMTGRMPSVHGLRYNGCLLPQRANTFVDVLAQAGYQTSSFGKSHLQPFTDLPLFDSDSVDRRLVEAWRSDRGNYDQEQPHTYSSDSLYPFQTPYYGFQVVDMVTGHGHRCGGHYGQWFRNNVPDWQAMFDPANELPHDYICPQSYRTPIPEEAYSTAYIADRTIDHLNTLNADDENPFFMFVSFPDPHHPFNPPGRYWDMYSTDQFSVDLPFEAHKNPPHPIRWLRDHYLSGGESLSPTTATYASEREVLEGMALTAGMITCIDDAIGRVMQTLKSRDLYNHTVVCFTADHGDYLGDFNMMRKGALPTRSITQVPFLWSDPRDRHAATNSSMASTLDIAQTVLSRAGEAPYRGIQGIDLNPAMQGRPTDRDELLIEFNDITGRMGLEQAARVRSLINDEWRYTIYGGLDWGELYNTKSDPRETHNLWDHPDYRDVRACLAERLNHHLTAQMDESPFANRQA